MLLSRIGYLHYVQHWALIFHIVCSSQPSGKDYYSFLADESSDVQKLKCHPHGTLTGKWWRWMEPRCICFRITHMEIMGPRCLPASLDSNWGGHAFSWASPWSPPLVYEPTAFPSAKDEGVHLTYLHIFESLLSALTHNIKLGLFRSLSLALLPWNEHWLLHTHSPPGWHLPDHTFHSGRAIWELSGPIPWPVCRTVCVPEECLGGTRAVIQRGSCQHTWGHRTHSARLRRAKPTVLGWQGATPLCWADKGPAPLSGRWSVFGKTAPGRV